MGPAGIAAAVSLSSSPAYQGRKPERVEQAQSKPQPEGTGCRGARSDRRSCAVGVNCGHIAELATNLNRGINAEVLGDNPKAASAALFAFPWRKRRQVNHGRADWRALVSQVREASFLACAIAPGALCIAECIGLPRAAKGGLG